jgi:hypothetical protein
MKRSEREGVARLLAEPSLSDGEQRRSSNRSAATAFRAEHRIRRFIVSGTDAHSHSGRQRRTARVGQLLARFAELVAEGEKDKEEKGL